MEIISSGLDYILSVLLWSTLTVSVILYIGRRSRVFLYIALYSLAWLLLEAAVLAMERQSAVSHFLIYVLSNANVIRGVLYGLTAVLMMAVLCSVLELKLTMRRLVAPILLSVWLLIAPLIQDTGIWGYWTFLLPYQIYVFLLSLFGLRRLGQLPARPYYPMLRRMLRLTALLAFLILVEDTINCRQYSVSMREYGVTLTRILETANPRNYCETVMQILLSCHALYAGGRIMTEALDSEDTPGAGSPDSVELQEPSTGSFAAAYGLSPREQELLPYLLENKSFLQIAEELYISKGTVKTHAHNIYQKTGAKDRAGLICIAAAFFTNSPEDEPRS